jgi:hypothetical protein
MMLDPGIFNNFGWGAVGLAALWMVLTKKPWRNGGNSSTKKGESAGEQSKEFWMMENKRIMKEAVDEAFKGRTEELRQMIRQEVGEWLDRRVGGGKE